MSGVVVEELGREPAQIALWDDYVSSHPQGTVYHLSAWRTIFEASFGYRSWLLLAREAATGRPCGALPLFLVATPFSRRLVSVPFRDRGGPLWDTAGTFDALVARAKEIAARVGATTVRLKTVHAYPAERVTANSLHEHFHWVHSLVDLRGVMPDAFWRRIGDKNRNMIRQAERHGLAFESLAVNEKSVQEWHRLHLATQQRLGVPPFPAKFFRVMSEELAKSAAIAMFGVRRGGSLEAATIALLHGKTAIYGYSASSGEGQQHRANDLLVCNLIRWAIEKQYDSVDLGSDSPAQESLLFFKRKWGATQSAIPSYVHGEAGALSDSSHPRYALARAVLRRTPSPILKIMGGRLTRYFG